MKKSTLLFFVWLGLTSLAFAQRDPKALQILDAMSEKYKSIPAYSADISYSLTNETEGLNEKFNGSILVKDDMYRLKLAGQEIVNNGNTMWTYLEEVNEVNIDNYNPEENEMTPSRIYTAYKEGFKYVYVEDKQIEGQQYHIVDLMPEDVKNTQFFRIRLQINAKDHTLKSWKIYDKTQSVYEYNIDNFEIENDVPDSRFTFNPSAYNNVEVIDLR